MHHMSWRWIVIFVVCSITLWGCRGGEIVKAPTEEIPESPTGPEQPETPHVPPREKWGAKVFGEVSTRPVVGSDGAIHVGTSAGYVYAISPEGEVQWKADLSGSVEEIQSLAFDDGGRIYVVARKRYASGFYLYALDAEAYGEELWHATASPYARSRALPPIGILVGPDGTVYAGNNGFAPDGTERWHHEVAEVVNMGVVDNEDAIFAIHFGGDMLYSFASDGTERWQRILPGVESVACASDGTIYATSFNVLYAIRPEDGSERWHVDVERRISRPVADDGTVYAWTSLFGPPDVIAVSPEGMEIWTFPYTGPEQTSLHLTLTLNSEGMLYATIGVYLYAIHTDDGTEAWSLEMDGYSAGVTIGPEGVLYFGTGRGYVYAMSR